MLAVTGFTIRGILGICFIFYTMDAVCKFRVDIIMTVCTIDFAQNIMGEIINRCIIVTVDAVQAVVYRLN